MNKLPHFQLRVTTEQKLYAKSLVEYSIEHHKVKDRLFGKDKQFVFRFTGTLGEIVFADAYSLNRPTKSYGAIDGQDNGKDFVLNINGKLHSVDIKSMHRNVGKLYKDYVMNIPIYQVKKPNSLTDSYHCINFHNDESGNTYATFLGYFNKIDLLEGKVGKEYRKGDIRYRKDNTPFTFRDDNYEVMMGELSPPLITNTIKWIYGYEEKYFY